MEDSVFKDSFWDRVDIQITGCWEWQGYVEVRDWGGYGEWSVGGHKKMRAHRASWLYTYGSLPEPPLQLNHSCNNSICVRPDHLYVGTQYDNIQDQIICGTHSKAGKPGSIPKKV